MKELSTLINEKYAKEKFYFTRNDLLPFIAESRVPTERYERTLSIIKPHLIKIRPTEFGALRSAATICKLEDEGTSETELSAIRGKLSSCKICRWSNTFYNWLRCGEVFEQEIFPFMHFCIAVTDNSEEFSKLFLPFWYQRLAFHPTKVFVAKTMDVTELKFNLSIRLVDNKESEVKVYSRQSRNQIAKKAIDQFQRVHPNQFKIEIKKYLLGNTDARTFIIKNK